jgi:hypothetical protein
MKLKEVVNLSFFMYISKKITFLLLPSNRAHSSFKEVTTTSKLSLLVFYVADVEAQSVNPLVAH